MDSSRHDVIDSAQYRTLPVWVWYPTEKDIATAPQYPLPEKWKQEQGLYLDTKIGKGGSRFLQGLKVWAVADAPVASTSQKFPVLIFVPGHTWLPTDYSSIIEELTSSGYIVVGFAPTGFASVTQLANGKKNNQRRASGPAAGHRVPGCPVCKERIVYLTGRLVTRQDQY